MLVFLSGCSGRNHSREAGYVSAPQVNLRDQVANVYNKVGTVKNAERVDILDRDRRFARVRTSSGVEGWMEQRYLVDQKVYDQFQKMAQQEQNDPVQATAVTRNETNMHISPGRDTDHLYQLTEGSKLSLLKRATSEKNLPGAVPRMANGSNAVKKKGPANSAAENPPAAPMEDWWLARDSQGHTGWVLGRMIDVDVPLDIAEYSEGQRIVAAHVLDQVQDADKKVAEYLVLLTDPKDGMPYDFNQIRVFTWNVKRHRYETAYREHNLQGFLPVTISQESVGAQGPLPVFTLHVKDDDGNLSERKYMLNTPIVHRVYAPGEEPKPASRKRARK